MNDEEILYQTYLVTFATASTLVRTGNRTRLEVLVRDVDHRAGLERLASELALTDATDLRAALRSRPQLLADIERRPPSSCGARTPACGDRERS